MDDVYSSAISQSFREHEKLSNLTLITYKEKILSLAKVIVNALRRESSIFWCGNGGSASDSEHLSAELLGRFNRDRKPFRSLSLLGESAKLTCIANDYGYNDIFTRQLEGLSSAGDILIVLSTSGLSKNILNVLEYAKKNNILSIAFLGKGGGVANDIADEVILINSLETARIQEMHLLIGHVLCDLIEKMMLGE